MRRLKFLTEADSVNYKHNIFNDSQKKNKQWCARSIPCSWTVSLMCF